MLQPGACVIDTLWHVATPAHKLCQVVVTATLAVELNIVLHCCIALDGVANAVVPMNSTFTFTTAAGYLRADCLPARYLNTRAVSFDLPSAGHCLVRKGVEHRPEVELKSCCRGSILAWHSRCSKGCWRPLMCMRVELAQWPCCVCVGVSASFLVSCITIRTTYDLDDLGVSLFWFGS